MKEAETKFSFSFDYLKFKVGDVVAYINRDITEFTARNVTQTDVDNFEAQGNAFEIFPPNNYYQMFVADEVEAKNNARANCTIQARKIAGIIEQVYGAKSGKYKALRYGEVNGAKDGNFMSLMRNIANICQTFVTNLTTYGLTQQMINDLLAETQLMEDKFHAIAVKEADRDDATEERIELANALYNNLSKYCQIGKSIWEDVSEAKYNDYVINPTVHHGLPKVQGVGAEYIATPGQEEIVVSWVVSEGATEYEVYSSQVAFGAKAGTFSIIQTTPLLTYHDNVVENSRFYYKVRAKNATQQSAFSDIVFVDVPASS